MEFRLSNAEKVREFTSQCLGVTTDRARKMTLQEVKFLITMIAEECMELVSATDLNVDCREVVMECTQSAKWPVIDDDRSDQNVIANQGDAMVDVIYFCYNAAAKAGIDCDQIFDVVHNANMAKKFPDGTFHKDANGKVVKPARWTPPDVLALVTKWDLRGYTWDRQ
jgi:predicted HAD superfamily Cof-like phosphohydrolase